jgi:hypothetical protein
MYRCKSQCVFVYNDVDERKLESICDSRMIQQYYDPVSRTALAINLFTECIEVFENFENFENLII